MEFRLLEYFLAVCEELHFTRAAEKLGISQPTLSQQIRTLEDRLGASLFHRIGKRTYLSEAGDILQRHARQACYELDQAQAAINELRGMQRGTLRIGCSGNHLLTRTMLAFHTRFPGIELSVSELATEETKNRLLHHQLDVGVVFLPLEDELLTSIPLFTEELQLAVSHSHPLAAAGAVELAALADVQILSLQKKYFVRQLFDAYSRAAGFTIMPSMELSTLDSLLHMARHGAGAAVVPRSYLAAANDPDICSVRIIEPVPQRTIGAMYRKETFMSNTLKMFLEQLVLDLQTI